MFRNVDEMWINQVEYLLKHGHSVGSRDGETVEEIGYTGYLSRPYHNIIFNPARKFSLPYACAETLWYLSGSDDTEMMEAYAPQYSRFAEDGKAFGAYGARWRRNPGFSRQSQVVRGKYNSQIEAVIGFLRENPETRQAVVTMWDSSDLIDSMSGTHKDIPCTLTLQFLCRENNLHLITNMRSNDVWLGLPYDVFAFTTLQMLVASECGMTLGNYHHNAGSEHLYLRNRDKAEAAIEFRGMIEAIVLPPSLDASSDCYTKSLHGDIEDAVASEYTLRAQSTPIDSIVSWCNEHIQRPILRDLVFGCGLKWCEYSDPSIFNNPLYEAFIMSK